ncbi:MAG: hypothetical protein HZA30_00480 [Candidatus Omnitrophica bacterium]|nr:hypothetical protein [Candidatus Omnitrophota bacterium]
MADEKEEEKKEEKIEVKTAPEQAKKEEKPTTTAAPKKEKPSNCAGCSKSIKKKRWYYRNGKYYCTKRCWKNALSKEEKPKATEDKK